jgi:glutathione S-transferase
MSQEHLLLPNTMPDITLYFLQASRSIRTAWQLEELGLDYKLEFSERENGKAPQHFKDASSDALGKFPLLKDGELVVGESGAIAEYVCCSEAFAILLMLR